MLVSATSNALTNTLEVYAANNCDATSTCVNISTGSNTQNNNCGHRSFCSNFGVGQNSQINNCACTEQCANIGSIGPGFSNNQNVACANSFACVNSNIGGGSRTQNTACQSVFPCENTGLNTNVVSNLATSCTSNGPDTTTLCQQGRTPVVVPNN